MKGDARFDIFISAVSSEFAAARTLISHRLTARGLRVRTQAEFPQSRTTTLAKLDDYIRDCDEVIAIVGTRSGAFPGAEEAAPYQHLLTRYGLERASYTQWEVVFACHHGRKPWFHVAAPGFPPESAPGPQDDPAAQARFREVFFALHGYDRTENFATLDGLRADVMEHPWPDHSGLVAALDRRKRVRHARTLERQPGTFRGRKAAVEDFVGLLLDDDPTHLLIQGSASVGKSAVALAVAHDPRIASAYEERRWLVPLEAADSFGDVLERVAMAVLPDAPVDEQSIEQKLAEAPALLVLDNLDVPWNVYAERHEIEAFLSDLAAIPGVRLLATFRGEQYVDGPMWVRRRLEPLALEDAINLFCAISRKSASEPGVAELVEALGGLPLAICLVARYADGIPMPVVMSEWKRDGVMLAETEGSYEPRRSSLPRSIELSLHSPAMTAAASNVFSLLSEVPAGLAFDDLGDLAPDGVRGWKVLFNLGLGTERLGRPDLLPPIRQYARQRSPLPSDEKTRVARHYLDLVMGASDVLGTMNATAITRRVRAEFKNIEAAFSYAHKAGMAIEAAAIEGFCGAAIPAGLDAEPVLVAVREACRQNKNVGGEAVATYRLGDSRLSRLDLQPARAYYEKAAALYDTAGDPARMVLCTISLGDVFLEAGPAGFGCAFHQYYEARKAALGLADSDQRSRIEGRALEGLAWLADRRMRPASTRRHARAARERFRAAGNVNGQANCLLLLGDLAYRSHAAEDALNNYRQAWRLFRRIASLRGEASARAGIADAAERLGRADIALRAYQKVLNLAEKAGDRRNEANARLRIADILERLATNRRAGRHDGDIDENVQTAGIHLGCAAAFFEKYGNEIERTNVQLIRDRLAQLPPPQ